FDTLPDAIIELKKQGVSDAVLNAMLTASSVNVTPADNHQQDCAQSLDKVLASFGIREKVLAVHSLRWSGKAIVNKASGSSSESIERVTVFPSSIYLSFQESNGRSTKEVLTPEFNYRTVGKTTTAVPAATIHKYQTAMKLEPIYIGQHRDQYSCALEGTEQIGNVSTVKLMVRGEGMEGLWNIDPAAGRLLRTTFTTEGTNQSVTDLSDWRRVDGVYLSFARHNVEGGVISDVTISEYQVNPATDASLFQAPADQPPAAPVTQSTDVLSDDEVQQALSGKGIDHSVLLFNMGELRSGAQAPAITLFMPEAVLAMSAKSHNNAFTQYEPSEEDKRRSLTIVAEGYAGTKITDGCTSITRVVLLSDPSGAVVKEAYLSEPLEENWKNNFGATNRCQGLRTKFSLDDVQEVKAAAPNGEFFVAVFSGNVDTKMYKIKRKHQSRLDLK
ncbi:MAG: hypothetical protein WBQ85_13630, partial [Candidatus Sulfotelmatobacter sp.]